MIDICTAGFMSPCLPMPFQVHAVTATGRYHGNDAGCRVGMTSHYWPSQISWCWWLRCRCL